MTERAKGERPPTLAQEFGRNQASPCWAHWDQPAIIRFKISQEPLPRWIGIPFSSISSVVCEGKEDGTLEMGIEWKDNATVQGIHIKGPKVAELFDVFCRHQASVIQAASPDIISVTTCIPKPVEFEGDRQ